MNKLLTCSVLLVTFLVALCECANPTGQNASPRKPLKSGKDLKMPTQIPEKKVRAKSSKSNKQGAVQDDFLQTEDWGDADLMQHPIDEEPRRVRTRKFRT